jgi:hypothetical protein
MERGGIWIPYTGRRRSRSIDFIRTRRQSARIMSTWIDSYHHMMLLRLLAITLVFGALWPGLWLLVTLWAAASRRIGARLAHRARSLMPRGAVLH